MNNAKTEFITYGSKSGLKRKPYLKSELEMKLLKAQNL